MISNRVYESAVLMNAALEDEQIQSLISRIKETIAKNGGEIIDLEDWGRKRLAYMIKKNKIGYYAIYRYKAPPTVLPKLERLFKLDENILRTLTIKLSKVALEQIRKDKAQSSSATQPVTETKNETVQSKKKKSETIETE